MPDPIRVGIINETDCPEAKMLMIAVGAPGQAWADYLDVDRRPRSWRSRNHPALLDRWTDIAAFGVVLVLSEVAGLQVLQRRPSTATYRDGVPRAWQGRPAARIRVRPSCVPALARFILTAAADRPARLVMGLELNEVAHG